MGAMGFIGLIGLMGFIAFIGWMDRIVLIFLIPADFFLRCQGIFNSSLLCCDSSSLAEYLRANVDVRRKLNPIVRPYGFHL